MQSDTLPVLKKPPDPIQLGNSRALDTRIPDKELSRYSATIDILCSHADPAAREWEVIAYRACSCFKLLTLLCAELEAGRLQVHVQIPFRFGPYTMHKIRHAHELC